MRKNLILLFVASLVSGSLIFTSSGMTASMKKEREHKKAILLVAFGTSVPEATKAFETIEKQVRDKYTGTEVRWAFTSRTIRSRQAAARGKIVDSPETALAKLMDEGYTHAAVLSLHVVPGEEFHDLRANSMLFAQMKGGFEKILVARPLLGNHTDMARVADVLSSRFQVGNAGEGVIFVGHGNSRHPSDAIYVAMDSLFRDRGAGFFAGSIEGHPTAGELLPKLAAAKVKKARLVPFMTVAGEHARNDIAGDDPESWKSALAKNGIESTTVLSGLSEYPEIVAIWLDHLEEVFAGL